MLQVLGWVVIFAFLYFSLSFSVMMLFCDKKMVAKIDGVVTIKLTNNKTRPRINITRRLLVEEAMTSFG